MKMFPVPSHSLEPWNVESIDGSDQSQFLQQPYQHDHKHNNIEQAFDRSRHGNVGFNEPADQADYH